MSQHPEQPKRPSQSNLLLKAQQQVMSSQGLGGFYQSPLKFISQNPQCQSTEQLINPQVKRSESHSRILLNDKQFYQLQPRVKTATDHNESRASAIKSSSIEQPRHQTSLYDQKTVQDISEIVAKYDVQLFEQQEENARTFLFQDSQFPLRYKNTMVEEQQDDMSTSTNNPDGFSYRPATQPVTKQHTKKVSQDLKQQKCCTKAQKRNSELETEIRHLKREVEQYDQIFRKFKDLKLDYQQVVLSFEKSEQIRREQKETIKTRDLKIAKLQKALRKAEKEIDRLGQQHRARSRTRSLSKTPRSTTSRPTTPKRNTSVTRRKSLPQQSATLRRAKRTPLIINLQTTGHLPQKRILNISQSRLSYQTTARIPAKQRSAYCSCSSARPQKSFR